LLRVVVQRTALANSFASYLNQLGLVRRHKIKTLNDILNEDTEDHHGSNGADRGNESQADTISPVSESLTANFDSSEWCANRPFCKSAVISRPGKKYCSDRCSLDGHILRRAREMVDDIEIVELNAILQRTM
jgi:hypothetical protein